jgi:acyl-CoA synthetase (NDP forming)
MPDEGSHAASDVHRHPLAPLLSPRSVALVGASARAGSIGNDMVRVLRDGGFAGEVLPVNPKYDLVEGLACYPSLVGLPAPPDLAVLGVGTGAVEGLFDEAVEADARAVLIYDNLHVRNEAAPTLLTRLRRRAAEAGVPVLGGNCMGYYNFDHRIHVSFQASPQRPAGGISLVCHSGSVFVLLAANDPRYRFNLVVSPGQEIGASVSDYMDFALELPSTRVVALFIETVRDPQGFVAALEKARARDVPVIVLKAGRTEVSARLAATHSGAIAGDDAAFEALFERYGVVRVKTLDELMAAALVLSQAKRPGPGGLAALTDSGGLRELMIDLADDLGMRFAEIAPETRARLEARLPPGLEAINPVDAAGPITGDFAGVFRDALHTLMDDPNVAMSLFEFEGRDDFLYTPAFVDIAEEAGATLDKPLVVLNSFSGAHNAGLAERLADAGVPLVNGVDTALLAARHALAYRDARARPAIEAPDPPSEAVVAGWRERLAAGGVLDEAESLALLRDFGVPAVEVAVAASPDDAVAAAERIGFPVALKTAAPLVHHKSDVDGVRLGLADTGSVADAYQDLAARLGPAVSVVPMVRGEAELAFGMVNDPQFGPFVMLATGGKLVEHDPDRRFALPPFDKATARRLIDRLRSRPLLDGLRGGPPADVAALARALAGFSVLADALGDLLEEIDVNPVIVGERGCMAVDALVIAKAPPEPTKFD